jgi:hypothetical protein
MPWHDQKPDQSRRTRFRKRDYKDSKDKINHPGFILICRNILLAAAETKMKRPEAL